MKKFQRIVEQNSVFEGYERQVRIIFDDETYAVKCYDGGKTVCAICEGVDDIRSTIIIPQSVFSILLKSSAKTRHKRAKRTFSKKD